MSRSVIDATRFTATSPHAYVKPASIIRALPSTSPVSRLHRANPNAQQSISNARGPPPPLIGPKKGNVPLAETAKEKVARLRAARLKERESQLTTWDKVVIRGRVWADSAHKITVLGLVIFSVIAVAIAGFTLTDMLVHNRRKRNAFYTEQHALYARRVLEAVEAEKAGRPLDADNVLVLTRERARLDADEIARQRSWWNSIKGFLLRGLKSGDEGEGEREGERRRPRETGVAVPSEGEILQRLGVNDADVLERVTRTEREREEGRKGEEGDQITMTAAAATTANTTESNEGEAEEDGSSRSRILQAIADTKQKLTTSQGDDERVAATEAAGVAVAGGPLDRMAEGAVRAVGDRIRGVGVEEKVGKMDTPNNDTNDNSSSSSSWTRWWRGGNR